MIKTAAVQARSVVSGKCSPSLQALEAVRFAVVVGDSLSPLYDTFRLSLCEEEERRPRIQHLSKANVT